MLLFHATLSPCLNELVVVDRLTLRLLIDLCLGRAGLVQPVRLVPLFVQLRSEFTLCTCARYSLQYFILLFGYHLFGFFWIVVGILHKYRVMHPKKLVVDLGAKHRY